MKRALILIMDPSRETRAMYADCFRHHGFAVAEAANGIEAVRLFQQLRPDLVITEISSEPEWLAAIRLIRGDGSGPKTAVIACSTSIDPRWPCTPASIDVDMALGKPMSPRALVAEARHLLANQLATAAQAG